MLFKDYEMESFFEGEVILLSQGLLHAKYRVVSNNAVIKVPNSLHIRKVENQFRLPAYFEIIALMKTIKVVEGELPIDSMNVYTWGEYKQLNKNYYGSK